MAVNKPVQSVLPAEGKLHAVLIGAAIILLTTTVPYLTILNIFLFSGIFIAGAVSLYYTILRFQVRLPYSEAYLTGCFAGLAGGALSELAAFFFMKFLDYRPGTESFSLVVGWMLEMAKGKPSLEEQVQQLVAAEKLAMAPLKLSIADLFINMGISGIMYGLIAGIGGAFAVLLLKRHARKG
ncbi:MAG: DUF4199 domain-containing protein [Chlorobiaceae bacterium]|nr:DUF4199 domain-containing protein [Chlorobiaceae bacterium]NTV59704.1 DUF4199 domain-containing protein [Chlorobiaceae bacterium]